MRRVKQADLFAAAAPEGFLYAEEFLSGAEEAELVLAFRDLPFEEARYKEWTARRRVVSYGGRYDFGANELEPAPPIPGFLGGLRGRVAEWSAHGRAALLDHVPNTAPLARIRLGHFLSSSLLTCKRASV